MQKTVAIIGGGASGMTAAIIAARNGAVVTLFEKNDRLGKKIPATGNGKCNLGNMNLSLEAFYTGNRRKLGHFLETFGAQETIAFFDSLGLMVKQKNGYLYPLSEQAASVLDVLRFEVRRQKVRVVSETAIMKIWKEGKTFLVSDGRNKYRFDRVILACGGKAAPKTGSDGSGYRLAKQLGHSLTEVVPALVQLRCREPWLKTVAGVRCEAEITVFSDHKQTATERGELQLTDYGISGIPVFQLSRVVNTLLLKQSEVKVKLNFLPDVNPEEFSEQWMKNRRKFLADRTVEEFFSGLLHKKIMIVCIKLAGLKPTDPASCVPEDQLRKTAELCCGLTVTVNGHNSFENAQVCAGGVPLDEVDENLQSVKVPGLYFAGELLDVDGKCGGYNLHWAWCSGSAAGKAAAREK